MTLIVVKPSCLGVLLVGNLYCSVTVGHWFLLRLIEDFVSVLKTYPPLETYGAESLCFITIPHGKLMVE